jgi:hypothetical protein
MILYGLKNKRGKNNKTRGRYITKIGGSVMTQRDEGHDFRDSKNKAMEYERKKITIIWGTDKEDKKTYRFETEEQLKYFMMGVDEGNGWLEYEVQE